MCNSFVSWHSAGYRDLGQLSYFPARLLMPDHVGEVGKTWSHSNFSDTQNSNSLVNWWFFLRVFHLSLTFSFLTFTSAHNILHTLDHTFSPSKTCNCLPSQTTTTTTTFVILLLLLISKARMAAAFSVSLVKICHMKTWQILVLWSK